MTRRDILLQRREARRNSGIDCDTIYGSAEGFDIQAISGLRVALEPAIIESNWQNQ